MSALVFRRHSDLGQWSAEASDLGFAPGVWPARITASLDGDIVTADRHTVRRDAEGDIVSVSYAPVGRKAILIVWND